MQRVVVLDTKCLVQSKVLSTISFPAVNVISLDSFLNELNK